MDDTDRYGPQTEQIEDLIARLEAVTGEQLQQIAAAAADADAARAAYAAARVLPPVRASVPVTYATRAATAARAVAAHATYATRAAAAARAAYATRAVARAAYALAVRHLISENGFTRGHYRTLTDPVASVLGALHSED
jgi:hypothetical protein